MTTFRSRAGFVIGFLASGFLCAARAEDIQRTNLCEVLQDPAKFHHQLIEVAGMLSSDFESFTLFDPRCKAESTVWVEYGGRANSPAIYCCGHESGAQRPLDLKVDGIALPLVRDKLFLDLDAWLKGRRGRTVHATMAGRFFAKSAGSGYGHLGCCSLFVLQQVLTIDRRRK